MAVEGTKIREMMEGKTLEKDNIKKMYDMVQNASEPEDKKKVMKHSVFFIGQLPLKENHIVDLEQTRRIVNGSVPFSEVDTYMDYLLKGLSTQKLLLEKEDGSYEVNTKYEKSVIKVRKIARAFQLEKEFTGSTIIMVSHKNRSALKFHKKIHMEESRIQVETC